MIDYTYYLSFYLEGETRKNPLFLSAEKADGIRVVHGRRNPNVAYIYPSKNDEDIASFLSCFQGFTKSFFRDEKTYSLLSKTLDLKQIPYETFLKRVDWEELRLLPSQKTGFSPVLLDLLGFEEKIFHLDIGYVHQCNFELAAKGLSLAGDLGKWGFDLTLSCFENETV